MLSVATCDMSELIKKNEELQRQLEQRDQQIESLNKENTALKKLVREQKV